MALIFEDLFNVKDIDAEGKKFEKVSRLQCRSEAYDMDLLLDVNVQVFPVDLNDRLSLALSRTLSREDVPDTGVYQPALGTSLLDDYEYVMHGKVYKYEEDKTSTTPKIAVYVSFGGLLMCLKGDVRNLSSLSKIGVDQRLYLLIRKSS